VKELKIRNIEFHTYKPKQERNFKVVLKHIYLSTDVDDIKKGIEELGLTIINVQNIKKRGINIVFHMFYVKLKSEKDNTNI